MRVARGGGTVGSSPHFDLPVGSAYATPYAINICEAIMAIKQWGAYFQLYASCPGSGNGSLLDIANDVRAPMMAVKMKPLRSALVGVSRLDSLHFDADRTVVTHQ